MLSCHELFGFMPAPMATEILDYAYNSDKEVYRATLKAVADARKLRPVFFERKPRTERHKEMLAMLSSPRLEEIAANLLRTWLTKTQTPMIVDFLNSLGIAHKEGVVDDFPPEVEDAKLTAAVDSLLAKYPPEKVAVYLNTLSKTSVSWENLQKMLEQEQRLHLA
jgi:hypothetical protein